MVAREPIGARPVFEDGNGKRRRQGVQRGRALGVTAGIARNDQRIFGPGENVRRLVDGVGIGGGRDSGPAQASVAYFGQLDVHAQHFPWKRKINRPAGLAPRQFQRPVDHRGDLRPVAEFVVPFDQLAQHARLVEHLLGPVNAGISRAVKFKLGERGPAGGEQDRNAIPAGVDRVRGAHRHVHHDRGHLSGGEVVAMGHGNGDVLMGNGNRLGQLGLVLDRRVSLDDRGEVGARVGEDVIHAPALQQPEVDLGDSDLP